MVATPYISRNTATVKRRLLTAAEIIAGLRGNPDTGKCLCPAHNDHNPSLIVKQSGDTVLVRCWAGCSQEAVISALRTLGLWVANGPAYQTTPRFQKNSPVKKDTTGLANRILRVAARSTLKPTAYLQTRGITLVPEGIALISRTEAGKLGLRRYPHMVVTIVKDDQPIGVQVTALTLDAKHKIEVEVKLTYGHCKGGYVGPV